MIRVDLHATSDLRRRAHAVPLCNHHSSVSTINLEISKADAVKDDIAGRSFCSVVGTLWTILIDSAGVRAPIQQDSNKEILPNIARSFSFLKPIDQVMHPMDVLIRTSTVQVQVHL